MKWKNRTKNYGSDIKINFLSAQRLGLSTSEIDSITPVGDSHSLGKRSLKIGLSNGQTLFLKHRNSHPENIIHEYIRNIFGALQLPYEVPRFVEESHYHFVSEVKQCLPSSKQEYVDCIRSIGALAFICQILGVSDLHRNNIFPIGKSVTPIDLEVALRPIELTGASKILESSILQSGLVATSPNDFSRGQLRIFSKYGLRYLQQNTTDFTTFRSIGIFLKGYLECISVVQRNLNSLTQTLSLLSGEPLRYVGRQTKEYIEAMDLHPRGVYQLDPLHNTPPLLLEEEIKQMEHGDIPIFHIRGSSQHLYVKNRIIIQKFFAAEPVEHYRNQILNFESFVHKQKILTPKILTSCCLKSSKF